MHPLGLPRKAKPVQCAADFAKVRGWPPTPKLAKSAVIQWPLPSNGDSRSNLGETPAICQNPKARNHQLVTGATCSREPACRGGKPPLRFVQPSNGAMTHDKHQRLKTANAGQQPRAPFRTSYVVRRTLVWTSIGRVPIIEGTRRLLTAAISRGFSDRHMTGTRSWYRSIALIPARK